MPDLHDLLERGAADYTPPPDLRARVSDRSRRRQRNRRSATVLAAVLVVAGIVGVVASRQAPTSPIVSERPSGPSVELTATFVSPRNGFSINHPEGAKVIPAIQTWGLSPQVDDGFDVTEVGSGLVFKAASTGDGLSGDDSIDEEVDEFLAMESVLPGGCHVPRAQQAEITIDGQPARIVECPNWIEATVVIGERLYLFGLQHDRSDARAIFDAFVATIDLTPETAVDFPSMTTSTAVSPTYGYSFRYGRGAYHPATQLWDPANQPLLDVDFDERFDGLETGFGGYFEAASTPIPDGISIDAWVDEYVTPVATGGCGVPRSQQAEITIDGQPGRMTECRNRIEATVVAGGRLYLFSLDFYSLEVDTPGSHEQAWFDDWIDTIDLTPETATVPHGADA